MARALNSVLASLMAGVVLGMLLPGCMAESQPGGDTGSGGGNGKGVSGVLVDGQGRPLAGAKVKAIQSREDIGGPMFKVPAAADSAFSDGAGRYQITSLSPGEYNLLGTYEEGVLVSLIKGVAYAGSQEGLQLGVDTLRAPGLVRGQVEGPSGRSLSGALCYLPGTSYVAVSDDSGRFTLLRVPPGVHALKYASPGYRRASDSIQVNSGRVTQVPVRRLEEDTVGNPPPPNRLESRYDTLRATVFLSWDPVSLSDVAGYLVYRDGPSGISSLPVHPGLVVGASFTDSIGPMVQEGVSTALVYRIKAVDRDANASLVASPSVTVQAIHPLTIAGILSADLRGAVGGESSIRDLVEFTFAYRNTRGHLREMRWLHQYEKEPWKVLARNMRLSVPGGQDTLSWRTTSETGTHRIRLELDDDAGVIDSREWEIHVFDLPPIANIAYPEEARVGDTIEVSALGSRDRNPSGRIVLWEWDIGRTGVFVEGGPTLRFKVPEASDGVLVSALAVRDEDGNAAVKEFRIRVLPAGP